MHLLEVSLADNVELLSCHMGQVRSDVSWKKWSLVRVDQQTFLWPRLDNPNPIGDAWK
jgi:hypothetical protein